MTTIQMNLWLVILMCKQTLKLSEVHLSFQSELAILSDELSSRGFLS